MSIDDIKGQFSILQVCDLLELSLVGSKSGTKVTKCFAHDDDHPSLVIMPKFSRFECKSCGAKGDQIDLICQFKGCTIPEALHFLDPNYGFKPITGNEYVTNHGLTAETLTKFKIKVLEDRIEIPIATGIKTRLLNKSDKFIQTPGATTCLFKTGEAKDFVIVTEGEIDAMVVNQQTGYPAWTGTGGAGDFKAEWLPDFAEFKTIYLAYDNDAAGEAGATGAATALGIERCKRLRVPKVSGKDWSDFFRYKKSEDFNELIDNCTNDFRGKTLKKVALKFTQFIRTGFETIDWEIEGLATGGTYALGGLEKCGKSAFAMNLVVNWLREGHDIGYINTELMEGEFFQRLVGVYNEYPYRKIAQEDVDKFVKRFDGHFYYAGPEDLQYNGVMDFETTYRKAEEFIKAGVKVLIFDNLTSFSVKTVGDQEGWRALQKALNQIDELTKKHGNVSICVIHSKPSISIADTPNNVRSLLKQERAEDIFKESIFIIQKPSTAGLYGGGQMHLLLAGAIFVWRPYQKFDDPARNSLTQIIMESNRNGKGFAGLFTFVGDRLLFLEPGKEPQSRIQDDFTKDVDIEEIK